MWRCRVGFGCKAARRSGPDWFEVPDRVGHTGVWPWGMYGGFALLPVAGFVVAGDGKKAALAGFGTRSADGLSS
jgi:hypothetical protein